MSFRERRGFEKTRELWVSSAQLARFFSKYVNSYEMCVLIVLFQITAEKGALFGSGVFEKMELSVNPKILRLMARIGHEPAIFNICIPVLNTPVKEMTFRGPVSGYISSVAAARRDVKV